MESTAGISNAPSAAPLPSPQETNIAIENNNAQEQPAHGDAPQEASSTPPLEPHDIERNFYKLREKLQEQVDPLKNTAFKVSMLGWLVLLGASIGQYIAAPSDGAPNKASPAYIAFTCTYFVGWLMIIRAIPLDYQRDVIEREADLFKYPGRFNWS